jgi:hypothetical protein
MYKLFKIGYYRKLPTDKPMTCEYMKSKNIDREVILSPDIYKLVIFPSCIYPLQIYDQKNLSEPPKSILVMKRKIMPDVMQNCKLAVDNIIKRYNILVSNGKEHAEIVECIFNLVSLHELIYRVYKDSGTVYLTVSDIDIAHLNETNT